MSNRTKGEWRAELNRDNDHSAPKEGHWGISGSEEDWDIARVWSDGNSPEADARFIAMAGTVAHKLDTLGYDGEKAIELLPEITPYLKELEAALWLHAATGNEWAVAKHTCFRKLLAKLQR